MPRPGHGHLRSAARSRSNLFRYWTNERADLLGRRWKPDRL